MRQATIAVFLLVAMFIMPLKVMLGQSSFRKVPDSLMQGELTEETYAKLTLATRYVKSEDRYPIGKRLLQYAQNNDYPAEQIAFCYRIMSNGKAHTDTDSFLYYNHLGSSAYSSDAVDAAVWPILTYERAEYFNSIEQYDSMQFYINKTLAFKSLRNHVAILGAAQQLRSNMYENSAKFDSAQLVLLDALNMLADYDQDNLTLQRIRAAIQIKLGKLYRKSNNFEAHRRFLLKTLKSTKDSTIRIILLGNLTTNYMESAQYDSAHMYAQQASQFIHDVESSNIAYRRLVETNTALGRFKEASSMKDSLNKYNALASKYIVKELTPNYEGALLIGLNKVSEGDSVFRDIFPNISLSNYNGDANIYLEYIKAMAPHHRGALIARELDTLKRLFYNNRRDHTLNIIEDTRIRYETDKITAENELLTLRSQTAETAARNRQQLLWLAAALLIAVAAGLFFFRREAGRRKKLNEELIQKNNRITLLSSEVNHRTSNYLTSIVKLLQEQKYKLEESGADTNTLEELERQTLVYTKLQQTLRTKDDQTIVPLEEYLTSLTDMLIESFHATGDPLQLNLHIDSINIDPGTAAPLALILNELLTNSIKYARRTDGVVKANFSCRREGDVLIVFYQDDGPAKHLSNTDRFSSGSGLDLIEGLTHQMEAERLEAGGFGYHARIDL